MVDDVKAKRLLKLADYLDTVPEEEFNYGHWSCGTTACAIGHAARMPYFQRLGLRLEPMPSCNCHFYPVMADDENSDEFAVGSEIFDLDEEEFAHLFMSEDLDDYEYRPGLGVRATAKEVAKHIRSFVKDRS